MHVSCQLTGVSLPSALLHAPSALVTCVGAHTAALGEGPMSVLDAGRSVARAMPTSRWVRPAAVTSPISCLTDSEPKEDVPPLSRGCNRFLACHTNRLIFRSAHVALISPRLNFPTMLFISACPISNTKSGGPGSVELHNLARAVGDIERELYMASKNSPAVTAARRGRNSAVSVANGTGLANKVIYELHLRLLEPKTKHAWANIK